MTGLADSAIRLPDASDDEHRTLNRLREQLAAKAPRNLLRASYYDGKRAIHQVGQIIPPQYYRLGVVLGWSAKAVDVLARRCNLDRFVWPDGDLDGVGYADMFRQNGMRSQVNSGMISALIQGTAFLVNTRGDVDKGEAAGLVHVKDATTATGDWNKRTHSMANLLSITGWDDEGEIKSLALYLDGVTVTAERDGAKWTVQRQEHPWGVPVEALVYRPRVGREFGTARISRPVMSLQDMAIRTVIRMEGHADVYSFPEMWLLGADETIFKNVDGSQKASWQIMLGRIKGIPDDENSENPRADVKQFAASSPQPHIDQLEMQANLFAGETDLPVTALGVQAKTNTTTADGSDNAERHLIAEAEGATEEWAAPLARTMQRSMAMAGGLDGVPDQWSSIAAKFRNPAYISLSAQADAGMKVLSVAPWLAETTVGLELLGLTDQQIERAVAERRRNGGSAALRAITEAAQSGRPVVTADAGGGAN